MTSTQETLARIAHAHDFDVTQNNDGLSIDVHVPWIDQRGREGVDVETANDIEELRAILGY